MNKGFVVSSGMLILLLLGGTAVAFYTGYIRIPEEGGGIQIGGTTYGGTYNYITYEQYQSDGSTAQDGTRVDLTTLFAPVLTLIPTLPTDCAGAGGTWHWEQDWVGCDNVGSPDCSSAAMQLVGYNCQAVGASWNCNALNAVWCRY